MDRPHRLSLAQVERASRTIDPLFRHTPQYVAEPLARALGLRLWVKVETANPLRCFKGRGAEFLLDELGRAPERASLVCASAGNFGQALAFAARKRGLALTVFAARGANALKLERMRDLGARVELAGADFDAAKDEAQRFAAETGARLVVDGLEPAISEGAGSIGVELAAIPEELEAVLLPLGNGALAAGTALWLKAHRPRTRIVVVGAAGAPAMVQSLEARRPIAAERVATLADGLAVRVPVPEALLDLEPLVDEAWLVEDEAMIEAVRLAHRHLGLVLEPAGAAGLAAGLSRRAELAGRTVATVLCGGNAEPEALRGWLA
jgi:threonine dehydratase